MILFFFDLEMPYRSWIVNQILASMRMSGNGDAIVCLFDAAQLYMFRMQLLWVGVVLSIL